MARGSRVTHDGIEAASKTYNRCTQLLRNELGLDPVDLGLGPKDTFEETVTLLRARLEQGKRSIDPDLGELTEDDFSFNEVLRLMRLTAITLAEPKKYRISRKAFIKAVNDVLQEEGGLKVSILRPKAKTGRYRWINNHIQTFLHRHRKVVRLPKKYPTDLMIIATRPETEVVTYGPSNLPGRSRRR